MLPMHGSGPARLSYSCPVPAPRWNGPGTVMSIVDLRQMHSRQITLLLEEEAQRWREELHWDYRASLDLIKKFVDAKSLAGSVALENGQVAGAAFYVLEGHQ